MHLDKNIEEKIKKNHYYFQKLHKNIRTSKEAILYLIMINPDIYYLLDEELSKDTEIILKAIFVKPEIIKAVDKELLLDKNLSKKIFKLTPKASKYYHELGLLTKVHLNNLPLGICEYFKRLEKKKD